MTSSDLERVPAPATDRRRGPVTAAWLLVGVLALLVAVPVLAALVSKAGAPGLPKGDFALIEMRALDVPGDLPLTGVYSRYGWDHPGPVLFYLAALPVRVFGAVGLDVTAALVNLASAVGLVIVMGRRGGQLLAVLGAIFALLLVRALQIEVVSIWNPWVPILPLALAVALAWSVWCRDWWALPWSAVVVTFVVQSHIGFAAFGAFLLGSSLVWALVVLVRDRRTELVGTPAEVRWPILGTRPVSRALVVSGLLLAVLWLPPIVDQLTRDPGNLSSILDFARSGQPGEASVGFGTAFRLLSEVVGIDGTFVEGISRTVLFPPDGASAWGLVAIVVPFLAATAFAVRRGAHDAVRLAVLVAVLVPIGWVSIAQITGPPYPYLVEWLLVVGGFLWFSAAWSVVSALWPRADRLTLVPLRSGEVRTQRLVVALGLVLVVLTVVTVATTVRSPGDGYAGGEVVEHFADPASNAIAAEDGLVLVTSGPVDMTNQAWALETSAIVSGLQAELQRRGFDVVTDDSREFLVGPEHVVGDRPVALRLTVSADTSVNPTRGPATIATYDYLEPAARDLYRQLDAKGGTVPPTPLEGADLADWGALRLAAVQYDLTVTDG